jgi:hypothetical protein
MSRKFGWIAFVVALAALAPWAAPGIEDRRPNVIVILADDLGPGDLSCYGGSIPTPHLDRMAAEGVRFIRYLQSLSAMIPPGAVLALSQGPGATQYTRSRSSPVRRRGRETGSILATDPPSEAGDGCEVRTPSRFSCRAVAWLVGPVAV